MRIFQLSEHWKISEFGGLTKTRVIGGALKMKIKKESLVLVGLAMQGLLYGTEGFTNTIEMVELGAGDDAPLLWSMQGTIANEGFGVLAGQPVPKSGALFILSTIEAEPFNDWFLAQTAVGVLAEAKITLTTHDDTVATGKNPNDSG